MLRFQLGAHSNALEDVVQELANRKVSIIQSSPIKHFAQASSRYTAGQKNIGNAMMKRPGIVEFAKTSLIVMAEMMSPGPTPATNINKPTKFDILDGVSKG